jgi:hypothetical protein
MGWADAEYCVNFDKRSDLFDMTSLFEAARSDNQITVEMPKDIPNDKMNIPLYIHSDNGLAYGKIDVDELLPHTLQFDRCDRIVFKDRTLDFQFELTHEEYKNIDTIIVNGIKFKKEE